MVGQKIVATQVFFQNFLDVGTVNLKDLKVGVAHPHSEMGEAPVLNFFIGTPIKYVGVRSSGQDLQSRICKCLQASSV